MSVGVAGAGSIAERSQWTWTSTVRVSPGVVIAPDLLQELVAADDLAGVAHEEREEVEDLRLHRDLAPVAEHPVAGEVDLDRPEIDDRRQRRARRLARRRTARMRADSSRELNGFVT